MYLDTLGDNCVKGQMWVQIIFHRPPTPKYGCYAAGGMCAVILLTFSRLYDSHGAAWLAVRLLLRRLRSRWSTGHSAPRMAWPRNVHRYAGNLPAMVCALT